MREGALAPLQAIVPKNAKNWPAAKWQRARRLHNSAGRGLPRLRLKRDAIRMNRHRALGCCLSMIFSENRRALFRIML
ncbi:hypothetical protein CV770_12430 [Bradyrhizobium sp. AC87j1]|nr:hypothetical protein CV770_12430 [Bradyrhizobium sp. AC87j1]